METCKTCKWFLPTVYSISACLYPLPYWVLQDQDAPCNTVSAIGGESCNCHEPKGDDDE